MSFPIQRGRRLRRTSALRALARETRVGADQLVAPLFVHEGERARQAISSLPGHARWTPDLVAPTGKSVLFRITLHLCNRCRPDNFVCKRAVHLAGIAVLEHLNLVDSGGLP